MPICPICAVKKINNVQLTLDHLKEHKYEKFVPVKCLYPGCNSKRFNKILLFKKHLQKYHYFNQDLESSEIINVDFDIADIEINDDSTFENLEISQASDIEEEDDDNLFTQVNINKIISEKQLCKSGLVLENPSAPFTLIESFIDIYGDCLNMFASTEIVQAFNKSTLKKKLLKRNEMNIQSFEIEEPEKEYADNKEYLDSFNCNSDFQINSDDSNSDDELDDEKTTMLIEKRKKISKKRSNAYCLPVEDLLKLNKDLIIENNELTCLLFFDEFCSGNPLNIGIGNRYFLNISISFKRLNGNFTDPILLSIILAKYTKKDRINLVTHKIREYLSHTFMYREKQVGIIISKILSDNFGLNQLLNTAKCRICNTERKYFSNFRTTQSANTRDNVRTISFDSGFTSLQGMVVDIFHDIDLGICLTALYEVIGILLYECQLKKSRLLELLCYITIQKKRSNITAIIDKNGYIDRQFNEYISYEKFVNSKNRKRKIRANAAQSISLLYSMIDLIHLHKTEFKLVTRHSGRKINACFNLLKSVKKIRKLANKENCNENDSKLMNLFVNEYYKYKNCILKNFVPTTKEHNLLHYGYLINEYQVFSSMNTAIIYISNILNSDSFLDEEISEIMNNINMSTPNCRQQKLLIYFFKKSVEKQTEKEFLNALKNIIILKNITLTEQGKKNISLVAKKAYNSVKKSQSEERSGITPKKYNNVFLYQKLYQLLKKLDVVAIEKSSFIRKFTFFTLIESFARSPNLFHFLDENSSNFKECNCICNKIQPKIINFFNTCFQFEIVSEENLSSIKIEELLTVPEEELVSCTIQVTDYLQIISFFLILLKKYFLKKGRVGEYNGQYNFLNVCLLLVGEKGALYGNYVVSNEVKAIANELKLSNIA
uniref:C2H2-type domain-containing protein n=1 Tax=Strongyloides stercoralis TaxID=6248 RepID=A0AAF5DQM4_STRER